MENINGIVMGGTINTLYRSLITCTLTCAGNHDQFVRELGHPGHTRGRGLWSFVVYRLKSQGCQRTSYI